MAEMRFPCPQCNQLIACDELWSGHQIQCPTCQASLTVPPKETATPAAPASPLVPQAPASSSPRLSIGQARHQPSTAPPQAAPGSTLARTAAGFVQPKKSGSAMKIVGWSLVVVALGVAGYFGFKYVKKTQDSANEESKKQAQMSDGGQVGHIANLNAVLDATEPGGRMLGGGGRDASLPSPRRRSGQNAAAIGGSDGEKELPVVPAIYTLDPATAKIPESKVNGMISGTNFVADGARLVLAQPGTLVLSFYQGKVASPDRDILVYLHLKAGEKLAGRTWEITPDTKGGPQVWKRWKPDPRFALKPQTYNTGYALKLELGSVTDGEIPGKIFVALPDPEKTVAAGVFTAETTLPDTPPSATPTGATNATAATPTTPTAPRKAPARPQ